MTDAAETIANFPRIASEDRHEQAESVRRLHWYTAPAGTTIDDLMRLEYWERIARRFSPLDRIEIVDDDRTFFAELIVLDTLGGLHLMPLRGVDLQNTGPRDAIPRNKTGVQAVYRGTFLKWVAVRGDVVLRDRFETEASALQWIAGHAKAAAK